MKFNTISIILSLLSFNLKVLSVPLNENELTSNINDTPENVIGNVNISEDEIYDTLPDDDIDVVINVTDAVIDEETDSDSDDEVATVPSIDTNECTSEECIENSKRILSNLDTSVNPCDDFYEFSCGGWMAMNAKKANYSSFSEVGDKVIVDLRDILENDYKSNDKLSQKERENDEKLFNTMKNVYTKCINNHTKDHNNKDVVIDFINNFNISEKIANPDGLTTLLADLHNTGIEMLFEVNPGSTFDLPYDYIPLIKSVNFSNRELLEALLEFELAKDDLSFEGDFKNENEYNEYLQQQKEIIEKYQEYVRKILQIIYGSNEDKINTMIKSIMGVQKILSSALIDTGYGQSKPIYSTEPTDSVNDMEIEMMTYHYEYDDSLDYTEYPEYTEGLINENTTDGENDYSGFESIISIKTLNEQYPLIDWKLYFDKRFEYYGINTTINEESMVTEYYDFHYIYEYLEKINNNDMANYMEWQAIEFIIDMGWVLSSSSMFENIIPEEFIQIKEQYENYLKSINDDEMEMGIKIETETEMKMKMNKEKYSQNDEMLFFEGDDANVKCLNILDTFMPLALNRYYVEIKYPENIKSESIKMVENIRNAMINRIKELEWLDESTREYAIEKVLKIKYVLGYSDLIKNIEIIYNFYKPLKNVHDDFLSMILGFMNVYYGNDFNKIYNENAEDIIERIEILQISRSYWVNAIYKIDKNVMDFPAAVLQSPLYDVNQPDYINYGGIGSIMGHELTHAFDNNGKKYDANGNENNWWTDNDNEEFDEFSQCFVDQYSSFSSEIKGKKYYVDGKLTLGENLADDGGLDRAFEAWIMSIKNNPQEAEKRNMLLPGLSDYTMEQLFYISYAHSQCAVNFDEFIFKDEHSPDRFRVNGVVSNSKRFAEIFNCPAKSPMNPEHKCKLW